MAKHAQCIFKFSCGGFFGGCWELEILKSSDGYLATYSRSFYPEPECRDFHVTDAQMEKLERQLDISGVEDWYCHYFSPVLDGTQWETYAWCTSSANATKQLLLSPSLLAHRCTCAHFPAHTCSMATAATVWAVQKWDISIPEYA